MKKYFYYASLARAIYVHLKYKSRYQQPFVCSKSQWDKKSTICTHITPLRNKLLCQLFRALRQQRISAKIKVWHQWQLKKSKSWGSFWSYQLDSSANPARLPQKWPKWAELAVLFSWQLQNGPQDFDFFNCHWCQTFI